MTSRSADSSRAGRALASPYLRSRPQIFAAPTRPGDGDRPTPQGSRQHVGVVDAAAASVTLQCGTRLTLRMPGCDGLYRKPCSHDAQVGIVERGVRIDLAKGDAAISCPRTVQVVEERTCSAFVVEMLVGRRR